MITTKKIYVQSTNTNPTCHSHTVLDAGLNLHLVFTKSKQWFYYDNNQWQEVSPREAKTRCSNFYFGHRFKEMQLP